MFILEPVFVMPFIAYLFLQETLSGFAILKGKCTEKERVRD